MWGANSSRSEGGYMDDSTAVEGAEGEEANKRNKELNVIPIVISELKKCGAESKLIDGTPINVITCVAIVRKIVHVTTKISYEIEDETGTMSIYKWLESDKDIPKGIEENMYVRIHGTVKGEDDGVFVIVLKMVPALKYAEVFSHLLEYTELAMRLENPDAVEATEERYDDDPELCHGLTMEQNIIYSLIKKKDDENGIERKEIKAQVSSNLVSKVDDILEFLVGEGHIYTARTDDHFKAT